MCLLVIIFDVNQFWLIYQTIVYSLFIFIFIAKLSLRSYFIIKNMPQGQILARAVGRRKEAVAQVQLVRGTGLFMINSKPGHDYLQNDSCTILSVQGPFDVFKKGHARSISAEKAQDASLETIDTIIKVKGGGLKGQADAIRLGIARALCLLEADNVTKQVRSAGVDTTPVVETKEELSTLALVVGLKKQLKDKGYLTQDSRVKERRKYGLKKARKATQYHKR